MPNKENSKNNVQNNKKQDGTMHPKSGPLEDRKKNEPQNKNHQDLF